MEQQFLISDNVATIFPHLPKTAGRTLVANIRQCSIEGDTFFHLGPNGRKEEPILKQYEEVARKSGCNGLVLFGHEVDEGVIQGLNKEVEVRLVTAIRHPLKRLESHFNMKRSAGVFSGGLSDYIRQQSNPMCRWYIRTFPSFVNDPFASLYDQASQVLSHFSDILIQESAKTDFPRFMKCLGGDFNSDFSTNRSGVEYAVASEGEQVSSFDMEVFLRQDLQLYAQQSGRENVYNARKTSELPPIKTGHRWWVPFLNTFRLLENFQVIAQMHESVSTNPVLCAATEPSSSAAEAGRRATNAIIENLDWVEQSPERIDNAIEAIQAFGIGEQPKGQGPLASLAQELYQSGGNGRLFDCVSPSWMELPRVSADIALMQGRWLSTAGRREEAIETFYEACTLAPHRPVGFKEMGVLANKINNKKLATKCALKVSELNPESKWAGTVLSQSLG